MRILIVEDGRSERELMARLLAAADHHVSQAADARSALQQLGSGPPEVLLTDWGLGSGPSGLELVKRVRSLATPHYVYCVMVTGRTNPADIGQAFAVGVDDVLRKPFCREELIARVEAPHRIARWALTAGAVRDCSGPFDATSLRTWREVEQIVTAEISDLIGQPLAVTATPCSAGATGMGAQIPLSLPVAQMEYQIAVGYLAGATRHKLAQLLLGDANAPDVAVADVVREIANTAGGAFKRAALSEGIVLTTGLPTVRNGGVADRAEASGKSRRWAASTEQGLSLLFGAEVVSRVNQRLPVPQLQEGMVLARDLNNEAGVLLVPGGTRLTASAVERLKALLGPTQAIEVAAAG